MGIALVVDDSKTILEMLAKCLSQDGLTVMTATNGADALAKLSTQTPDIIVLDVVLPDRSGFEICRDLKAEATTSAIPIIICSTKDTDMDKFWGKKQGADAYLTKPIDQAELSKTVKQLIGH
ncbi:response regulator [Leptolyngbyaceae cyanobacterium CCMR0082]|uniref:Response regulator n=2 Tax=Adonisia turfae TaxID=2950184 RepID=A0A6M0S480_9CYAN|nr:response regulator [Adonisia turfae]MDV3349366.1 response regulator [Leptothoe sp. LEGE 181152]NEZ58275.1 response regulator [Adonisia turfae CCMR0081]NEZ62781.1 response regulator [Adonisia turfae CCMR0082]